MRGLFLFFTLASVAQAITPSDAEARLKMAHQIARERNDRSLVSQVERLGRKFKEELPSDAETQLSELEVKVGIDAGGWSMAGQPLFRPTPEMMEKSKALGQQLQAAMASDDATKVKAVTQEMLAVLGNQAGVPDGRRMGKKPQGMQLSEATATKLFLDAIKSLGSPIKQLMEGTPLPDQMVRLYGYLLNACADIQPFVAKHQPADIPDLQKLAAGCAKILITLQQPTGHLPFPDLRGKNIRFGDMINRQLDAGTVEVKDGWLITPDPDGGSQFDTGVCGVALIKAGAVFQNESWIAAGLKAAEWALTQKCCANFNYNAFSMSLLAEAYRQNQEERFLKGALHKFRVGVAPGQAPNGRWMDAHNARTVYHIIILRALGDLATVVKEERTEIDAVAKPAIKALLDEFDAMGITVEALPEMLAISTLYPEDARIKTAVSAMASSIIEKCTDGKNVKMGSQPNQLAVVPLVK
ncbi:MAG: hypothetical protein NTV80_08515 [Verrucomicrobia bacterium]|nr:hypothetical protein [Verrucomicrobiota bacterium]